MKAVVYHQYGGPEVVKFEDINMPIPNENEVLIMVKAASITRADTMMRSGLPRLGRLMLGFSKPKYPIMGTGFAGIVTRMGSNVNKFKIGDRVYGESIFGRGSHTEYTCVPQDGVISILPENLSFEEAAPICDGALTSINFLRNLASIQPGQRILINGASGSLGTAAVQLAKSLGGIVTGVCSTSNTALVRSLGADYVIDYKKNSLKDHQETYDIIFDSVGKLKFKDCKKILTEKGIYMSPVLQLPLLFQMIWTSFFDSKKAKFSATGTLPASKLMELLKEVEMFSTFGQLKTIIDRSYSMQAATEAHQYIDSGRKRGNVIMKIS